MNQKKLQKKKQDIQLINTQFKMGQSINEIEYQQAKIIVDTYIKEINKLLVVDNYCICCTTKKIKPLKDMGLNEGLIKPLEQENGCWDDGTVTKVSFGYGSKHDMSSFYIAICDECFDNLIKKKLVINTREIYNNLIK